MGQARERTRAAALLRERLGVVVIGPRPSPNCDRLARLAGRSGQLLWASVYAFVLRLGEFLADPRLASASESLAASMAREFVMEQAQVITQLKLDIPDQRAHLREAYLPAFERTVGALVEWHQGAA